MVKDNASIYLARSSDHNGFETCVQHLAMTGCLDAAFASKLGTGEFDEEQASVGLCTGLLHDIGKYSNEFQNMIRAANNGK